MQREQGWGANLCNNSGETKEVRFLIKYNDFSLKSGIYQKLNSLPKIQAKISKNLKFPANPLSSKAGKT